MATSHYCNGKWREGSLASCPRHKKLDRKQTSPLQPGDRGGETASSAKSAPSSGSTSSAKSGGGSSSSSSSSGGGSGDS